MMGIYVRILGPGYIVRCIERIITIINWGRQTQMPGVGVELGGSCLFIYLCIGAI
jgi:hypothetical protein